MKRESDIIKRLERRLKRERPGLRAQCRMMPRPRPGHRLYTEAEETSLKAGVMLALYSRDGALHLPLIRRAGTVFHHRDQIGLPGGRLEGDETYDQAALRETQEELGISPEKIRVLGHLTPLYIPPSNYCIYPVVGVLDETPVFLPDPWEVAEVIEVPLAHLLDSRHLRRENWIIQGEPVQVPFYAFGHHKIWGATAMVLAEFLELAGGRPPQAPAAGGGRNRVPGSRNPRRRMGGS